MLPSREQVLLQADALPEPPVAVEAYWDGDSSGWFVVLSAVLKGDAGYQSHCLSVLQDGGDMRLLNGQVPPWGEARFAQEVGEELAARFGVPFYFPSPEHPEEDRPRWWERDRGYPCRRCGIPLLQRDPCPWRGVCYECHLVEEREKREAMLTPEERAGPRCHICGKPAAGTLADSPACRGCLERYEVYQCARCGKGVFILKTERHTDNCKMCDLRSRLNIAPEEHRQAIRVAKAEGGKFAAIVAAKRLLGLSLHDAVDAVHELCADDPGVSG
jgi:hypothetical protein